MLKRIKPSLFMLVLLGLVLILSVSAVAFTPKEQLGKLIFDDTNLSSPDGQACASCHDEKVAFIDTTSGLPVSVGAVDHRVGLRNAPSILYKRDLPPFHEDDPITVFAGGMFWDGRAFDLVEQAKGPFINPLEMHNPNKKLVIHDITKADYAPLFKQVYGDNIFNDYEQAYDAMADAIAAFMKSNEMNKFNSKFDKFLDGQATLTPQEEEGRQLFFGGQANCSICHHTAEGAPPDKKQAVFTDSRFFNVGVPANPDNPFYSTIPALNPDGTAFIDLGLGGALKDQGKDPTVYTPFLGTFKVPSLRNVALTAPFMHNGVFPTLKDVVHFYNTRDEPGSGFIPEVNQNIFDQITIPGIGTIDFLGNMKLTSEQEDAIVAFLHTLTDDFAP